MEDDKCETPIHSGEYVSLRAYIERIILEHDKRYDQRFKDLETTIKDYFLSFEKAISKAEVATERRFEGVNEFRKTLDDAQRTLMPRNEAIVLVDGVRTRMDAGDKNITALQLAQSTSVTQVQYLELQKQVNELRESRSQYQGLSSQKESTVTTDRWVIGVAILAAGTIFTIVFGGIEIALRLSGH